MRTVRLLSKKDSIYSTEVNLHVLQGTTIEHVLNTMVVPWYHAQRNFGSTFLFCICTYYSNYNNWLITTLGVGLITEPTPKPNLNQYFPE